MSVEPGCPFCKIVALKDPAAREVYRDDHVVAFFPLEPATLGHTLIVPRNHLPDIWSLDDETAMHLALATTHIAKTVRAAMHSEGLNVIQSNGRAATQTVPHLHVHIVPRWSGDAIGPIWPLATDYSESAKDSAWEAIRLVGRELDSP